jgi:hypothetical protein
MPGRFFPLGALSELGVPAVVQAVVEQGRAKTSTRVLGAAWELTWDKLVHLIFLPVLDATRPWQLRYTLGTGLLGVCQTAYRFETIQRTLSELAHAQLGTPLRYGLGRVWVKTLIGSGRPLHLYIDAHLKPHWTHIFMPCGHVAMLNRVMPCTRQLMVTTPEGYVLEILDRVGDAHLSHDLPGIEQELERVTRHAVTLTIVDREANSVELAQNYAQSDHFALLTLLDDSVAAGLVLGTPEATQIFRLTGRWQSLTAEPGASLAPAVWGPARQDPEDPRVFWLVREDATDQLRAVYSLSQPVIDCAPDVAAVLRGSGARRIYRARWPAMEGVIREMIAGANLNENYGYDSYEVPNRLRQRQFAEAEALVGITAKQLDHVQAQIAQTQTHLIERVETLTAQQAELAQGQIERGAEQQARQQAGQSTRRVEQQLAALEHQTQTLAERAARLSARAETGPLAKLNARCGKLEAKLAERQTTLQTIDLTQLMFERDLEKDQIMTDLQAALLNAHRWCGEHYFSGEWSRLELETATARIYRQRGHVVYTDDQVTVTLAMFADRAEQGLAEAACLKFNAAQVRDAAGRLIAMGVAPFSNCVRQF